MLTNTIMADVQSAADLRNLAVQKVGIKSLRHPVLVEDEDIFGKPYGFHTVATFDMFVDLPADRKGTHMSRFLTLLSEKPTVLSMHTLPSYIDLMLTRLEASHAFLEASFAFFLEKEAPISKVRSFLDYDVTFKGRVQNGCIQTGVRMVVPVTSVCPCSKEISQYGAHNQRSHVTLEAWFNQPTAITPFIRLIESQASCDLYGALKRVDEKYVTEKAYENPKFVEDLVRDIALELNAHPHLASYRISSENFESIHNHSAFAEICSQTSS